MKTILLDVETWDLCQDLSGNIALASEPYALAQDVASACRLFQGECYYDTTKGIPYWAQILSHAPPLALLKSKFVAAAMTVPGVQNAKSFIASIVNRKVRGQVQFTDADGTPMATGF